jgi:DNA polymerase
MSKKEMFAKVNKEILSCKRCPLWKTRNRAVPGEGPMSPKVMIIGQAPGVEEDRTGRPFVGRAGRLLDSLFDIAKIERRKVFITSPVKCFPPKNRKPKKKEIQACLPYLKKQIEILKPQKFILLGEVAFKVFFPKDRLKDFRGKWTKKDKKEFFITYHPAAGLRFPKIKKILKKDFKKLRHSLKDS